MTKVPDVSLSRLPNNLGDYLLIVREVREVDSGDEPVVAIEVTGELRPQLSTVGGAIPLCLVLTPPAALLLADRLVKEVHNYLSPDPQLDPAALLSGLSGKGGLQEMVEEFEKRLTEDRTPL